MQPFEAPPATDGITAALRRSLPADNTTTLLAPSSLSLSSVAAKDINYLDAKIHTGKSHIPGRSATATTRSSNPFRSTSRDHLPSFASCIASFDVMPLGYSPARSLTGGGPPPPPAPSPHPMRHSATSHKLQHTALTVPNPMWSPNPQRAVDDVNCFPISNEAYISPMRPRMMSEKPPHPRVDEELSYHTLQSVSADNSSTVMDVPPAVIERDDDDEEDHHNNTYLTPFRHTIVTSHLVTPLVATTNSLLPPLHPSVSPLPPTKDVSLLNNTPVNGCSSSERRKFDSLLRQPHSTNTNTPVPIKTAPEIDDEQKPSREPFVQPFHNDEVRAKQLAESLFPLFLKFVQDELFEKKAVVPPTYLPTNKKKMSVQEAFQSFLSLEPTTSGTAMTRSRWNMVAEHHVQKPPNAAAIISGIEDVTLGERPCFAYYPPRFRGVGRTAWGRSLEWGI